MSKLKLPKVYQELSDAIAHEDDVDDIEVTVTQGVLRRACMQISGDAATIERVRGAKQHYVNINGSANAIPIVFVTDLKAAMLGTGHQTPQFLTPAAKGDDRG